METLAERIAREGPVNELDAVGWIVRLAKKLESLHSHGLAHGGVSPEAMKTASASRLSLGMLVPTGSARNRLEFRSPERLQNEAASRTDDTWSTATTLYTMLTGASPFVAGDDDAIRHKIRTGTFAALSTFDVGDDDLQHIIEAALTPSMANRTSSLAAFREALEGWHPDSRVRDLPPMVDEQPEDDDDDARTVMRPVSAADAVRVLIAQREQASAAATRASEPVREAPAAAASTPSSANESAKAPPSNVAMQNHGLFEDDDENAKTSMISVPPMAMFGNRGPATVPAPPPVDMKSAPPSASRPTTGFGGMRSAGGPAARSSLAKATFAGGFTAKSVLERPAPLANPAPIPGISRDAVIDDVDGEATVMREAPIDVLRKATASIAPPGGDRKTPVDPTSAAVAATTASANPAPALATNPTPAMAEGSSSFASSSLLDDHPDAGKELEARDGPVSESHGLNATTIMGESASATATPLPGQTPSASAYSPQAPAPTGLATSALTAPSTSGMVAPSGFGMPPRSAPAMAAPVAPTATPMPLARVPVAPPPVVAESAAQPSALRGLFIGVGLALLIIVAAAGVYFFVVKG